jgi:hypothetical protein
VGEDHQGKDDHQGTATEVGGERGQQERDRDAGDDPGRSVVMIGW